MALEWACDVGVVYALLAINAPAEWVPHGRTSGA